MDNEVLRQAPLFSALDDEAATALRGSLSEAKLRRGDVLFHEGDSGDRLYIVLTTIVLALLLYGLVWGRA